MAKKTIDFLEVATLPVTEVLQVAGFKIEVRGLTIGQLEKMRKPIEGKPRDPLEITVDLIIECCFDADTGQRLIPLEEREKVTRLNPQVWKQLNEAIARVNGFVSGNLKATDTEDSSSE